MSVCSNVSSKTSYLSVCNGVFSQYYNVKRDKRPARFVYTLRARDEKSRDTHRHRRHHHGGGGRSHANYQIAFIITKIALQKYMFYNDDDTHEPNPRVAWRFTAKASPSPSTGDVFFPPLIYERTRVTRW